MPAPREPPARTARPRPVVAPPSRGQYPSFSELLLIPVTSTLALAAIAVTVSELALPDIADVVVMEGDLFSAELWRPFTSTLLHGNFLHILFNLQWLIVLGWYVEREHGSLRTAAGYALAALASSCAEQALFHGGIGLSGVVYAVAAYGWARGRTDAAWARVVNERTTQILVGWFFFCIVTTVLDIFPVANVAHGVGALVGALAGLAVERVWARPALGLVVALSVVLDLAPVRDEVNLVEAPALEADQSGTDLLAAGDLPGALAASERAERLAPHDARIVYNYGVMLGRVGQIASSCEAYRRARTLDPSFEPAAAAAESCENAW